MEVTSLSASAAQIVRAAEQNPGVAVKLLRRAMDAEKDVVSTLLPLPETGRLDVRA
ncbi:MAG: hypothetical protein RMJ43_01395 [Chloroherpetonaceae bacterium]|nr:hypothetical protein [Chthonomonadaceae bacterium]MDW8206463.1 hypothetical protein [Chloroherpetonaceae bacterium]